MVACGRRWGKTTLGIVLGVPQACTYPVGWFAPTYKYLEQAWDDTLAVLYPAIEAGQVQAQKTDRVLRFAGGGRLDYWTLERPNAGRGRKYKRVIIDEATVARGLEDDWTMAIRPTLTDLRGDAWFLSTPKGHDYFHRLWSLGQGGEPGWASWQQPSVSNPILDPEEIEEAQRSLPRDAYSQEYLAEFLADSANPFGIAAIRRCLADLVPAKPAVWGVDLAKSMDWTVAIGLDDEGRTVAFQRWQSDWRQTVARLAAMCRDVPALVDSTGVGDPIVEQLQAECPLVEGYKFTSPSKQQLMEGLAVAIQQRQVAFPPGVIQHELEQFQYEYRPSGVRYSAPDGCHDDCVVALGLAVRCLQVRPLEARLASLDAGEDEDDLMWRTDPAEIERYWQ